MVLKVPAGVYEFIVNVGAEFVPAGVYEFIVSVGAGCVCTWSAVFWPTPGVVVCVTVAVAAMALIVPVKVFGVPLNVGAATLPVKVAGVPLNTGATAALMVPVYAAMDLWYTPLGAVFSSGVVNAVTTILPALICK